jgi:glycosyltransferase involved in cell wall biosynthesis
MTVSVVIPAYNAEAFLRKAINSVLNQTHPAKEIIVVDDGSKDGTCAVVESYGDRVRLIRQQNQGPAITRNTGANAATGDYIAFLDSDDGWNPEKLEKQLAAFRAAPDSVLCYTSLMMLQEDGARTIQRAADPKTIATALRVGNPCITPSCVMVSRQVFEQVGGFSTTLKGCEDWELWLRLRAVGPFCINEEPLTRYQVNNTGVSSNAELLLSEAKLLLEDRLLAGLGGVSRMVWRQRILSYQNYMAALTARASGKHSLELRCILSSFVLWPSPMWHPHRLKVLAVTLKRSAFPQKTPGSKSPLSPV